MPSDPDPDELVKTLIALTRGQHEWLRRRAFDGRTSIAAEIRALVAQAISAENQPTSGAPDASQRAAGGEEAR